jgi:hypothetical protein
MRLLSLLLVLLAVTASPSFATDELGYLEALSRHYADSQPELRTYVVEVKTSKLQEMIREMTANMPADLPRPVSPTLKKYWSRDAGQSLIHMEVEQPFPYMAEMVRRFSDRFNIDLKTFFLPPEGRGMREDLLKKATVKNFESRIEDSRNLHISLEFPEPTDIGEAFFRRGLRIPHTDILSVAFDLDPEQELLRRIEIITSSDVRYAVEIRHLDLKTGHVPQDIRLTTADGTVDDRLITTFAESGGFLLPTRQVRTLRRNNRTQTIAVEFLDYRINIDLPPSVRTELGLRAKRSP